MKDKKYLRKGNKPTKYLMITAKIIGLVTAVVFLISFSRGTVNAAINKEISNQYQDKDLDVLKKNVNKGAVNFMGKLINVSDGKLIEQNNVKAYKQLKKSVDDRYERQKDVAHLYDGKRNYQDDVTKSLLDRIDNELLQENNQDVYQVQKNKLDTIRIWYEQTTDAQKYISRSWIMFNDDHSSISIKRISMVNTYDKLIKNKQIKKDLASEVEQMNDYLNSHSKENSKVAAARKALEDLKNSPLTMKHKAASVDIISSLEKSNSTSDELGDAGITAKHVLYLNKAKQQLGYMTLDNGHYVAENGFIDVLSSSISGGQYTVKQILNSADSAAIITDPNSNSFGKYLSNATTDQLSDLGLSDTENSTGDYNSAKPVFWLKNNVTLQNSIYFGSSNSIGFIYSGGSSYANGIKVSASDLSKLQGQVSSGLLIYVK